MEQHKEFFLTMLSAVVLLFLISVLFLDINIWFIALYFGTHLVCAMLGRLLGWKGAVPVITVSVAMIIVTWYGFAILILTALPTTLYGAYARHRDQPADADT